MPVDYGIHLREHDVVDGGVDTVSDQRQCGVPEQSEEHHSEKSYSLKYSKI